MVCAKHKKTYAVRCPNCDKEAQDKEQGLTDTIELLNQEKHFWEKPFRRPTKWIENAAYDGGRRCPPVFRNKVYSAMTMLTNKYKDLLDNRKLADLDNALQDNLDDIFAVSRNDTEWTNVCHALGGKHNEAVYTPDGKFLGIQQSFGYTGFERVDVNPYTQYASVDDYTTMAGNLDDSKRIYLHDKNVHISTVVHEMLHYFCDRKFYAVFKSGVGPEWNAVNEGITEYFTRRAYTGGERGAYQEEYDKVLDLVRVGLTEKEMQEAYFMGHTEPLVDKMKAGAMTEENIAGPGMANVLDFAVKRKAQRRGAGGASATGEQQPHQ
jgi:hypothetical protein